MERKKKRKKKKTRAQLKLNRVYDNARKTTPVRITEETVILLKALKKGKTQTYDSVIRDALTALSLFETSETRFALSDRLLSSRTIQEARGAAVQEAVRTGRIPEKPLIVLALGCDDE